MSNTMQHQMIQNAPDRNARPAGAQDVAARHGGMAFQLAAARVIVRTMQPAGAFVDGISVPSRRRCSS
jgi:hypothetical protein